MVSSCFGTMKEIVSLTPTNNPSGKDLERYHLKACEELSSLGLTVISHATDNNRINQNLYSRLAPNKSYRYVNPFHPYNNIELIFDSIHIAKNVRNNWLNKKDFRKTFFYPDFDDFNKICSASFVDLRQLHEIDRETGKLVTKVYKLNKQTLYPSSFERQRVPPLLNILHPSTIAALRESLVVDETGGTANFLELWRTWFSIMNNRCLYKGNYERDVWLSPITSENDFQVVFLRKFAIWLRDWRTKDESGVGLTVDTFEAAIVTTEGIINLIEDSFKKYHISVFLPGKFQTNDLEKRFGRYRGLCGSNYLVSVKDIFEAEKKLRLKQLISTLPHELIVPKEGLKVRKNVDLTEFIGILNSDYLKNFKNEDHGAFLYVCGYGGHSIVQKLKCDLCCDLIVKAKGSDTKNEYFDSIQRGGLIVPTENCCFILYHMNAILDEILRNSEVKRIFQQHENQQSILIALTFLSFENDNNFVIDFDNYCECQTKYSDLFYPLMKTFANILLNNYRKLVNDQSEMEKQKKSIEKLQKRKLINENILKNISIENISPQNQAKIPTEEDCSISGRSIPKNRKLSIFNKSKIL